MSISPTGSPASSRSSSPWPNSSSSSSSKTSRSSSPKREYDSDCFSDGSRSKSPSRSSSPSPSPKLTPLPSRPASPAPAQHQPTTHAKRPAAEISGGPTFQPKFVQKTQSSINFGGFDTDDEASSSDDDNSAPPTKPILSNLGPFKINQQLLRNFQRELLGLAPTWTQNSSNPDQDSDQDLNDPDLATALSFSQQHENFRSQEDDPSLLAALALSLQESQESGSIGPNKIDGVTTQIVSGDGNCFFHSLAVLLQEKKEPIPNFDATDITHETLREFFAPDSTDREWVSTDAIHAVAKKLRPGTLLSMIDTRNPRNGFYMIAYHDLQGETSVYEVVDGIIPEIALGEISLYLPLQFTGNHFDPILNHDRFENGLINKASQDVCTAPIAASSIAGGGGSGGSGGSGGR